MKKHFAIAAALLGALVASTGTAKADNSFSLHLEPGLAQPLTAPQAQIYSTGGVLTVKPMFTLIPNLSVGPSVSAMYLPRQVDNGQNAGVVWQFGGTARLQGDRRSTAPGFWHVLNPWIDTDLALGVTGDLYRPTWDVAIGAEVPLDQNHIAWIGPFLRYTHMFNTSDIQDGQLLDKRDTNFLQAGISISFDTPTHRRVERVETERLVKKEVPAACPPPPATVAVVPVVDRLHVSQIVYFDHDSSKLRWESRDKLDNVVAQIKNHPNETINVEGHASSDGNKQYNQKLSAQRTAAVVAYLVQHGIDPKHLNGNAHGIDMPAAPNNTQEGRERNRRVEFAVTFTSVDSK